MRVVLLLPALVVPLLLGGCGGGDDGGSPAEPTLAATASAERVAYAKAADEVCAQAVARGKAIPQPATAAQIVPLFERVLANGVAGQQALLALTPPTEDADALEAAFLDPIAQQVANFRKALPLVKAAAAAPDPGAALNRVPDPGAAVTVNLDYIEKYGMPACAVFAGKK